MAFLSHQQAYGHMTREEKGYRVMVFWGLLGLVESEEEIEKRSRDPPLHLRRRDLILN